MKNQWRDWRSKWLRDVKKTIISEYDWDEEAPAADATPEALDQRVFPNKASKGPWAGGKIDPDLASELLIDGEAIALGCTRVRGCLPDAGMVLRLSSQAAWALQHCCRCTWAAKHLSKLASLLPMPAHCPASSPL